MDLQRKYDELDEIVSSINLLIDEIDDQDYIDDLNEIKYRAQDELEEVQEKILEENEREEREMNYQFERSRF
jgi:hypothetical protein|nr:MAG TPA: hypothetical protein [Caudoviricetes sp.]